MKRRTFCAVATLAATAPGLALAAGDTITILVPFAAGGSGDITARLLAQFWQETWGQTVVVDNKPGANGIIGMQAAKVAPADGRTLLLASTPTFAANPSLFRTLPYDPERDFTLVAVLGAGGSYMLVRPEAPWKTVAGFVAAAKAQPREVTYGYFNATSQVPGALLAARRDRDHGRAVPPDRPGARRSHRGADPEPVRGHDGGRSRRQLGPPVGARRDLGAAAAAVSRPADPGRELSWLRGHRQSRHRRARRDADKLEINRRVNAAIVAAPMKGRLADFGFAVDPLDLPASIAYARAERAKWVEYVALAKIEPQ